MAPADEGGEPACWAHLFEAQWPDIAARDDLHRVGADRTGPWSEMLGGVADSLTKAGSLAQVRLVQEWCRDFTHRPFGSSAPGHHQLITTIRGRNHMRSRRLRWLALALPLSLGGRELR